MTAITHAYILPSQLKVKYRKFYFTFVCKLNSTTMKLALLILLATLLATTSRAQEKGDTKIIVKNELKAEENYRAAASAFLDNDFKVLEKDDTFLMVTFGPHVYEYKVKRLTSGRYMFASVRAKDGEIIVTLQDKPSGKKKKETIYDPDKEVFKVPFEIAADIVKDLGVVSYGR